MSKKFWSLFIVELVAIQLPYVSHAQDVHLSVDKEHMVGVIESHLASLEGWRTGDVLIRIATTGDGKHVEEGETIHDVVQPKEVVGPGAKNLVRTQLEFGAAERHIHSLVNTGRDRFRVVLRDEEGSPFQGQYAIDWDVSRNVPVRFVSHHVPPEASQPVHTATVDWNSYEGNYLPKFARLTQCSIPEYANQTFQLIEETTV